MLRAWAFGLACLLIGCGDDAEVGAPGGGGAGGGGGGSGGSGGGEVTMLPPPDLGDWEGTDAPPLTPSDAPPGGLADVDATHYDGIACGPHEATVFDLLIPNGASEPLPLILFVHGGGFVSGSRTDSYSGSFAQEARDYLEAGFAYATADYRTLFAGDGVRNPLQDVQVCLQFIRYHADHFGIDPTRVVMTGGSAGAGTSLWLGTSDEMADDSHPILAMSTRLSGVVPHRTQATYDVLRWLEVFSPEYTDLVQEAFDSGQYDVQLVAFYAAPNVEAVTEDPFYGDYRRAIDMLANMSADDAPVWAVTPDGDDPPNNQEVFFHHPYHVRALVERGAEVGLEVIGHAPDIGLVAEETRVEFALRVTE